MRALLLASAWSAGARVTAHAQSPAEVRAQARAPGQAKPHPAAIARDALEQRLKATEDSIARLDARLAEFERAARAETRDTVRQGALVLATSPVLTAAARAALDATWPALRRQWGDGALLRAYAGAVVRVLAPPRPASRTLAGGPAPLAAASSLDGATNQDMPPRPILGAGAGDARPPLVSLVRNDRVEHETRLEITPGDTAAALAGYLVATTAELVQERADKTFASWLLRGRLADAATNYQAAFVDLVTAPALVNRQCASGNAARCREALGLVIVSDPQATWYTEEDRRVIARAWWKARQHPTVNGEPPENPCSPTPITAACRTFIATLAPLVWTRPLGSDARMSLLKVATDLGGDGAFSRLVADTTLPMDARIAAAAAHPLDDVVLEWRTRVMGAHPEPVRPRLTLLLGSALLCLAALVLVAVRQERA
jgi:hypothetical protein